MDEAPAPNELQPGPEPEPPPRRRLPMLGLVAGLALLAALAVAWKLRRTPPPAPAQVLFEETLPGWQVARARPGGAAGGPKSQLLLTQAASWPAVAAVLRHLDEGWPDEGATRAAVVELNRAVASAGLRYFVDVQKVAGRPMLMTYALVQRVPWRAGEREVAVLRLRRLDHLNIEMGMLGETDGVQPLVLLDRLEALLVTDLPLAFAAPDPKPADEVERVALAHLGRLLQARGGKELAATVEKLRRREALVEAMRGRLHGGSVQLSRPDGFVLGEGWFEHMRPYTELTRPGGPLLLDTDLRLAMRADEELREPEAAAALDGALDFMAAATEAHEARHALDTLEEQAGRTLPPPAPLIELMESSETRFQVLAEHELRAYLGELHDSPVPACLSLLKLTRGAFGRGARATPHFYAAHLLLTRLAGDTPSTPAAQLDRWCAAPDGELRQQAAAAWQWLYASPLPAATRQPGPP